MKLRIKGNSVRLRLLRGEVARLREEGRVTEETRFAPGAALVYSLEIADVGAIHASFEAKHLRVLLPRRTAMEWATSEHVGMIAEQPLADGESLRILVEKDFQCLKPRTSGQWEDESDAFPNPNPTCG